MCSRLRLGVDSGWLHWIGEVDAVLGWGDDTLGAGHHSLEHREFSP